MHFQSVLTILRFIYLYKKKLKACPNSGEEDRAKITIGDRSRRWFGHDKDVAIVVLGCRVW